MSPSPSDQDLQFYYFGLYAALKRYRTATLLGWLIVLVGCVSVPLGWNVARSHGMIDIALSVCTVAAGLAVVSLSISALETYLNVPFRGKNEGNGVDDRAIVIEEIILLMKDIDHGGWQEAYAAIGKLKTMETRHGLPPLS